MKSKRAAAENHLWWSRRFLILCCVLQIIYGIISMCFAVVLNTVANTASTAKSMDELWRVGIIAILFGIAYPASRALADSATKTYGERAAEAMRGRLNRAIFSMNSAGFSEQDTGVYLNTLTGDVVLLNDQYYTQIPLLFGYVAQFTFCVIYSFTLNPAVGAVLMVLSVVQYIVPMLFGRMLNRLTVAQSRMSASFTSKAKELLLGFSVVKSYGGEMHIQNEFDQANADMTNARKNAAVMARVMGCSNMLVALMIVLLSVLTAGSFVVAGTMAPATLLTVFYIANRFSMPVMDFSLAYTQIKSSRGVRKKLSDFLLEHPEITQEKSRPIQHGLETRQLSFSYHEDAPALRGISWSFQMGKKYLILGESGCGKSTLLKVLAGQYPSHGVYVDGEALESLPAGRLAGKLVLVGQQPYVFCRSVADNIDFLGTGDRQRIMEEVEACCLSDFVAALPQGADTLVDEEQRQLSGGQKARIGLARAIYTRPDVLLLDEVTSALDPDIARKIEEMILELKDVMVIHISHKPSPDLTARYDGVLTMENGRLVHVEIKPNGKGERGPLCAKR